MELLERAVAALKSGKPADLERPMDAGPEVELHLPALIPEDYGSRCPSSFGAVQAHRQHANA